MKLPGLKKIIHSKRRMHTIIYYRPQYISEVMELTYVSKDRLIDYENVVYVHNRILISCEEMCNDAVFYNLVRNGKYNVEQSQKDGQRIISLLCGIQDN